MTVNVALWVGAFIGLAVAVGVIVARWAVNRAHVRGYLEGRSASIANAEAEYRRGFEAGRHAASRLYRVRS